MSRNCSTLRTRSCLPDPHFSDNGNDSHLTSVNPPSPTKQEDILKPICWNVRNLPAKDEILLCQRWKSVGNLWYFYWRLQKRLVLNESAIKTAVASKIPSLLFFAIVFLFTKIFLFMGSWNNMLPFLINNFVVVGRSGEFCSRNSLSTQRQNVI